MIWQVFGLQVLLANAAGLSHCSPGSTTPLPQEPQDTLTDRTAVQFTGTWWSSTVIVRVKLPLPGQLNVVAAKLLFVNGSMPGAEAVHLYVSTSDALPSDAVEPTAIVPVGPVASSETVQLVSCGRRRCCRRPCRGGELSRRAVRRMTPRVG
jgi:hypothetical protein